jgi:hypothetical protein
MTGGMFSLLGIPPAIGRTINAEDDRESAADLVVISHGLWQQQFGSDPSILGRTINLDDAAYTVVGVLPQGFTVWIFRTSRSGYR